MDVDPSSVEVLEPGARLHSGLEDGDPLVGTAGWRRLTDLRTAAEAGPPPRPLRGTTRAWAELFAELHRLAHPLLDAGWVVVSTETDAHGTFGDSVFYDLERDGQVIELEHCDVEGDLVAWPMGEPEDPDEPIEATLRLVSPTADQCTEAFRQEAWLP
ncbi:MAG: hypothetical protein IPM45_13290 [Acidimicrobiales bacterium]|nr:hypothetical protein [Acidimicrobiales bacterium]